MRSLISAAVLVLVDGATAWAEEQTAPTYQGKPVEFWVKRLESDDAKERELAMKAIEAFGKDATPAAAILVRWLDDRCDEYQYFAHRQLREIGPGAKEYVPDLIRKLKNENQPHLTDVVGVLESIGPDAKPAIKELHRIFCHDKDERTRGHALEAITAIDVKDEEVRATVIAYLERAPTEVARWSPVLDYLAKLGPDAKDAIPSLRKAVDPEKYGTEGVCQTLGKIGTASLPTLIDLSKHKSPEIRKFAVKGIAEVGSAAKSSVADLLPLLADEDDMVRIEAARTLWMVDKHEKALAFFVETLEAECKLAKTPRPSDDGPMPGAGRVWDDRWRAGADRALKIAEYLMEIGNDAKPALPVLKKLCEVPGPRARGFGPSTNPFRDAMAEAVKSIESAANPEGSSR